jgi:release factor glutamine methyltransferase
MTQQPTKPVESWTIGRLLDTATGYLKEKGSPSARLDGELLLADALHLERIQLYTQHDRPLNAAEVSAYRALIARRAAHEPVAYIRGRAFFRHLSLDVRSGVLIPRPETEELVDLALETLRRRPAWGDLPAAPGAAPEAGPTPASAASAGSMPTDALSGGSDATPPTIVDVGTGSGAIALSLAQEAGVRVLAVDASREALAVAAANAEALGLSGRVVFRDADLLSGIAAASLDLVVSNPPYVRAGDMPGLAPDVRLFEPVAALDGGPDGLDVYRRLVPQAACALRPGGVLLLEVGEDQASAVCDLARAAGFAGVAVHKDLSRKERMVEATLPGAAMLTAGGLSETETLALRRALDAGAVIGLPTDTVYGIAAKWDSWAGIRRLFAAKQRSPEQPVAVLFASVGAIEAALPDLDGTAARVLERLLPGPYTFVVATEAPRPELVGTPDSLGVRVPDQPDLLRMLAAVDVPVAATSANITGLPAPATAGDADPLLLAHCSAAVLPGGGSAAVAGVASTVVDLRPLAQGEAPVVLREGAVAGDEVLRLISASLA